ncbi:MAG: diguanylate cyclase [Gammaproteobacteria bacterium]|nr:diguanylate cyclase [Gammaproteobacteria bacterium]
MSSSIADEYEALLQFLYIAPIGLVQIQNDGEIVLVNPLCAQLLMPLSRDGALCNLFTALQDVAPDLGSRVKGFDADYGMICDNVQLHVGTGRSPSASPKVLSLSLLRLDSQRMMGVLSDITVSVQRERELRQSQAWIQTLVTGLTDYALLTLDAEGYCTEWNDGVRRVTGFESSDILGQSYRLFYPPEGTSEQRETERLREADLSGWSLDEGWRSRKNGTRYWGSCLVAPMQDTGAPSGEVRSYSLIIRDISDRQEARDAARRALSCDHLTGLANRRVLFEMAEVELQRWARYARPLSVVMIDADHFKQINDRHGHAAGDAVLRHLATGLAAGFGPMDTVARLGGEEFVVLMPGSDIAAAELAANSLCRSIQQQSVDVDGVCIRYTVSAGVVAMDPEVGDLDELLRRADAAMYAAKASGRNRVVRWDAIERPALALQTV